MRRLPILVLALALAATGVAELRGSAAAAPASAPEAGTAKKKKPKGAKVRIGESEFGRVVMSGRGQALYLFDRESGPTSECYGDCAAAWPPFLTRGKPVAGKGVDPKLLGTTRRTDGPRQVTYKGHPLYYYVHDSPGVILCQDVFEFGGLWLVVNPRGNAVR